jgi:hypothetical protein
MYPPYSYDVVVIFIKNFKQLWNRKVCTIYALWPQIFLKPCIIISIIDPSG